MWPCTVCRAAHTAASSLRSAAALLDAITAPLAAVRLDKVLSQHGYCARSEARQFLRRHEVTAGAPSSSFSSSSSSASPPLQSGSSIVNPATLLVDGARLGDLPGVQLHLAMHKPPGAVCSHAEDEGATVFDLLPPSFLLRKPPLECVGRLDKGATGLLLFTQSGALNARLAAPEARVGKEYVVRLAAPLSAPQFERAAALLRAGGLELADGGVAKPAELLPAHAGDVAAAAGGGGGGAAAAAASVVRLRVSEGRHHLVRRLFGALGCSVVALRREAVGGLRLAALGLAPGEWRALSRPQLELLLSGGGGSGAQ
jgi:16S rRNA pseudouridine516 synthase